VEEDKVKSDQYKANGNDLFREGKYADAVV
jgi:hypothetical protein